MRTPRLLLALGSSLAALVAMPVLAHADFHAWAKTPPMGWNSWDCFATTITEEQTLQQADFMAKELKAHGWEYIVVDIQWYEPGAKNHDYRKDAVLTMDGFGRLQPASNRFPSAADGSGFRSLAERVHAKGLKFGIHLMRGIPRQAVEKNLPIEGTAYHAQDIADKVHVCPWNPDMYGVDMSKPGAQAYYDSVFAMIAGWGVDYVKVDDLSRPYFQNLREVEAIRKAIDKTGRPMVLSLSPGATDIKAADHVAGHANLWRISDDFWDRWLSLREQFWRLSLWNDHRLEGAWPDADMLPLGTLVLGQRGTRFTPDEQVTLMTLWSIARSPLMHGGDLTKTDPATLALLTNDEVLAVNQHSQGNHPLFDKGGLIAWVAKDPAGGDTYLAVFNTRDRLALTQANAPEPALLLSKEPGAEGHINTPLAGATKLVLVAEPVREPDAFTQVLWEHPRFVLKDGSERSLTELAWTRVDAQWDSFKVKKDKAGQVLGLSAQCSALVEYPVPGDAVAFRADVRVDEKPNSEPTGHVRVLTVVGTQANEDQGAGLPVTIDLAQLGYKGEVRIRDLWTHENLGVQKGLFAPQVPYHGARLFRIQAQP